MLALGVVGGLVVGREGLRDAGVQVAKKVAREVAALAAATADDHKGRRARDGGLGVGGVLLPRNLTDVVAGRGRVVHGDVGLGVVGVGAVDELERGLVDVEAGGGDAVVEVHAGGRVDGAGAGAAVDRVGGVAAEQRDLGAGGQRQGGVVVFQKDGALAEDLADELVGDLGGLGAAAELRVIVVGVPVLGAGNMLDGGRTAAQVVVEQRTEHVRAHVGRSGHAHEARRHRSVGHELAASDGLLRLCGLELLVCHGWFLSDEKSPPAAAGGRREWRRAVLYVNCASGLNSSGSGCYLGMCRTFGRLRGTSRRGLA